MNQTKADLLQERLGQWVSCNDTDLYPTVHRIAAEAISALREAQAEIERLREFRSWFSADAAPPESRLGEQAAPTSEEEHGVLIEREYCGRIEWFLGQKNYEWTTDSTKAMRFARAEDACLFWCQWLKKPKYEDWKITRHIWQARASHQAPIDLDKDTEEARDAARWNWFLGQLHGGFWKAAEWETTDRYGDGRWNEATEPDEFLQMIGNEPEAAAALAAAEGKEHG